MRNTTRTPGDEPPPPNKESDNRDVCFVKEWNNLSCGQVVYRNVSTFSPFAFPRGARHLPVRHGVRSLNQELGVNHKRLAVTHTHTAQHAWQPGLWFFYTRGCSDFMWDMGRTLLVRNRCHLTVLLEQRAHNVTWMSAVMRVAKTLLLAANVSAWSPEFYRTATMSGVGAMLMGPLTEIVGSIASDHNDRKRRTVTELASGLDRCARGNFSDLKSAASSIEQSLAGLNTLDYLSAALLMRDLANDTDQEKLDTIQIANMCVQDSHPSVLANGLCTQPVELWDVRTITARWSWRAHNSSTASIPRPWSSLNGSVCSLSDSWPLCVSCRDSLSEQSCRYKCSQAHRGKPSVLAPQDATRQTLLYGQAIRTDFYPIMDRQGVLGKANVWRPVWEKVVTQLPRVSPHRGMHATKSASEEGPR